MSETDTVKLLRECDAGVEMAIASIEEVLEYVKNDQLRKLLDDSLCENMESRNRIHELLNEYNDEGKDPGLTAKGMSWIKTNVKLIMNESDSVIADLITDGCHMGMKLLNRYINQYPAADNRAENEARTLTGIQEKLAQNIRSYL